MAMFKKILLPIDMTDGHQHALDAAAELASRGGGEVTLLHVIEVLAGSSMEEEKAFYGRLKDAARKHLQKLGAPLTSRQVPWQSEIRFGNRGPDIVKYAQETRANLILLTAPRLDPDNLTTGWGSLSYKVSLFSPCPVLLVR